MCVLNVKRRENSDAENQLKGSKHHTFKTSFSTCWDAVLATGHVKFQEDSEKVIST